MLLDNLNLAAVPIVRKTAKNAPTRELLDNLVLIALPIVRIIGKKCACERDNG